MLVVRYTGDWIFRARRSTWVTQNKRDLMACISPTSPCRIASGTNPISCSSPTMYWQGYPTRQAILGAMGSSVTWQSVNSFHSITVQPFEYHLLKLDNFCTAYAPTNNVITHRATLFLGPGFVLWHCDPWFSSGHP